MQVDMDAGRTASTSTSSGTAITTGTDRHSFHDHGYHEHNVNFAEKKESDARDMERAESYPGPLRRRHTSEIADVISPPTEVHLSDAESLASINAPPSEEEVERGSVRGVYPPAKAYSPFSMPVLTSLAPASVLGALARLGLEAITTYDGRAIFPLAWAQAGGCLIMGFSLGLRDQIGGFYGPLYTALTTGFCGSLTTFSGWQFDIFISWANTTDAHRDWFSDVIDGISKTIFTLAVSLSSVTLGLHLARVVSNHIPRFRPAPPLFRHIFRITSVLIYVLTIPLYFALSPSFRHKATAAILFSFPGTLTRYALAMTLTPHLRLFPLGTFVANTGGTALFAMFHVLQRIPNLPGSTSCAILQGLMDGYCGCLTTVSTFAVEVGALQTSNAWLYVGLSWIVSQLLILVILGPSWWAGHVSESHMCAFA